MAVLKLNYDQAERILELQGLRKWFDMKYGLADRLAGKPRQVLKAVDGVDLTIFRGENLGLVGESGCGKSTLAKTVLRLYEPTAGKVIFLGTDISHIRGEQLRVLRPGIQMIFQDPYSSLNPRMTVYEAIEELLKVHRKCPENACRDRVAQLLEMCGLSMDVAGRFPAEFSGGQRQRIGIAKALALEPAFVIADEPVSALDVSIQAQIINLLHDLQNRLDLTILFISHDLRVVHHITHRVMVMYLGSMVELGPTEEIFQRPLHPYTLVLTKAAPILDPTNRNREYAIEGETPSPIHTPSGCKFHPRCVFCKEKCKRETPALRELAPGRFAACHYPLGGEG